jgi:DNA-binding transcriptional LysR family regulator
MVASGMGVTILSDLVYRHWSLEAQRIEIRDVTDHIPSMDVGVAWKTGAEQSPSTTTLHEFLVRNAQLHATTRKASREARNLKPKRTL